MSRIRNIIEGASPANASEHCLAGALSILAGAYSGIAHTRALAYDHHLVPARKLPVPVICVGNLTMGGTGKTPVTMAVAQFLLAEGRRPAIISRGYGASRRSPSDLAVVSDGTRPLVGADVAGDESFLMANILKNVPIIVCANRYAAGMKAVSEFYADVIVMDDGFQHRKLHRDVDFVLLDASRDPHSLRMFPRGTLREGFEALKRASLIGLTRGDQSQYLEAWRGVVKRYSPGCAPVDIRFEVAGLVADCGRGETQPAEWLAHRPVYAFCGLGNPDSFFDSLLSRQVDLRGRKAFVDHHQYTGEDLNSMAKEARANGAECLVTTDKDAVKILEHSSVDLAIFVLRIEAQFDQASLRQKLL